MQLNSSRAAMQLNAVDPPAQSPGSRNVSLLLGAILVLLALFALHAARPVGVPIVLGLLLALVLLPLRRLLERLGLPPAAAAGLVILGMVGALGTIALVLSGPVTVWLERAPLYILTIKVHLRSLMLGIEEVRKATEEVGQMVEAAQGESLQVVVQQQTLGEALLTGTGRLFTSALIVLVLSFFLLASGRQLRRNGARLFTRFGDRRRALRISGAIEREVSTYLLTVTLINAGLGLAVAAVAWLAGLPNALLWGALAAVLNYIPYIGPLVTQVLLFLVGIVVFNDPVQALLAPALVIGLNVLEGHVVTPSILARRLMLSPVVVFVALILWGWLWGVAGVLIAVPMLAAVKIACDHIPAATALGQLLGERRN